MKKLYGGSRNRTLLGEFPSEKAMIRFLKSTHSLRIEKGFTLFINKFSDLQIEFNGAPKGSYYYSIGRKC